MFVCLSTEDNIFENPFLGSLSLPFRRLSMVRLRGLLPAEPLRSRPLGGGDQVRPRQRPQDARTSGKTGLVPERSAALVLCGPEHELAFWRRAEHQRPRHPHLLGHRPVALPH